MKPHRLLLIAVAIAQFTAGSRAQGDLLISEFMANNDGVLTDAAGDDSDWIEIHNPTTNNVDLSGWKLADSSSQWSFPEDSAMAPGAFLIVFASGKSFLNERDDAGNLHTSFRLSADGESLSLIDPEGILVSHYDRPPRQRENVSYGTVIDVQELVGHRSPARILILDSPADPAWRGGIPFDDGDWLQGKAAVGFNAGNGPVVGSERPSFTAYYVHAGTEGNQNYGGLLGMDFEVIVPIEVTDLGVFDSGSDGLHATLRAALWTRVGDRGGTKLAEEIFTPNEPGQLAGGSRFKALHSPLQLGPGTYTIVASGYNGEEPNGNLGVGLVEEPWENRSGDGAIAFVGGSRYGTSGLFPDRIDGGPENRYAAGTFIFKGPNPLIRQTDLTQAMAGQSSSALVRIPFELGGSDSVGFLRLTLSYDDGVVAWINGVEIVRCNAPETLDVSSTATAEGGTIETFVIPSDLLAPDEGSNLLALQGLNLSAEDPDFLLAAKLEAVTNTGAALRFFTHPTPGEPNDPAGVFGFLAAPNFSHSHGFYELPIQLGLQSNDPEAEIFYATGGSEPGTGAFLYKGPIEVATTTLLRARAYREGFEPSPTATQSYLFLQDVATQGEAPGGYPARWKSTPADYAMDTNSGDYARAAGDAAFDESEARAAIVESLKALPTLSIAAAPEDLFDAQDGIYANPGGRGQVWERPVSVELLEPRGGDGFQADAGLRIMGGTSRNLGVTKKLSMRLLFKKAYGQGWLDYPFFGEEGVSRFNTLPLRANVRDSWVTSFSSGRGLYIADQWAKQTQLEMGQPATRGRFVHLYVNGLYWGVYNPTERPDAAFAESYLDGEREDYDVIKFCCPHRTVAGDMKTWNELIAICQAGLESKESYQFIQGNDPDGTRNPNYRVLIDVDNFIDYVINGQHHAAVDWPGNYYVLRDRVEERSAGFRFFTWDNDLAMVNGNLRSNKVRTDPGHNWWTQSPGVMDVALRKNAEYRMRFADRVFQHYFKGALTRERNLARWNAIAAQIEPALYAESARWGDVLGNLLTVQDHWKPMENKLREDYFPQRNPIVLTQLRAEGLYPKIDAPVFSLPEGPVEPGTLLAIGGGSIFSSNRVYYTTNGSDPRLPGGTIRPGAQLLPTPLTKTPIEESATFLARSWRDGEWSAVNSASYLTGVLASSESLVISEIMYHPAIDAGLEFIELSNRSEITIELSLARFTDGVGFVFPVGTFLDPGQQVLIARDREKFEQHYGPGLPVAGVFEGSLANEGESMILAAYDGSIISTFIYDDRAPWPLADGSGASLERVGLGSSLPDGEAASWRAGEAGGSPGRVPEADVDFPDEPLADADGDGMNALLEFGLGGDDADPAQTPWPTTRVEHRVGLTVRLLAFQKRTALAGLVYTIEWSDDLTEWYTFEEGLMLESRESLSAGLEAVEYRLLQDKAAFFLRIRLYGDG